MKKINESWDGSTEGFREENPFNTVLMNLDDVRRTWPSEASSEAYSYFDKLWDKLIKEGYNWESDNPETTKTEETKEEIDTPEGVVELSSGEIRVPKGVVETPTGEIKTTTMAVKPKMVPISTFIEMLRADIVSFKFEKKDGSIRVAYGTRNRDIIARVLGPSTSSSGTKRPAREGFVTYFDIEKMSFRCFAEERFLGVIDEHAKFTPTHVSESKFADFSTFTYINEALDCDWSDDYEEEE